MSSGVCALCLNEKCLKISHIIPNAVFKKIKRASGSGQLIKFDDAKNSIVERSQESWGERLLCEECESKIGKYEQYGLSLLRERRAPLVEDHPKGLLFLNHDYSKFKLFLTSLIWRSAVSKQYVFSVVFLSPAVQEEARLSLLKEKAMGFRRLGCSLSRLIDETGEARGGFSQESLSEIIVPPIPRIKNGGMYTYLFVMEGFLIEFFVPHVPFRISSGLGIFKKSPNLFIPNESIFDVKEMVDLLVTGYAKNERGLVSL